MSLGSAVSSGLVSILSVLWKPLLFAGSGVALAHAVWYGPRIENLNLKLELAKKENIRLEEVIESQNKAIEEASNESKEAFDNILERIENKINEENQKTESIIEDIIAEGMPEGCIESSTYLIEQTENLKWNNESE